MGGITPQAPSGFTISTGNYAGNDAVNRAIPHTLGKIPKVIFISSSVATGSCNFTLNGEAFIKSGLAQIKLAVTAPTTTDFYVGNATSTEGSANAGGANYQWVAF